MSLYPVTSNLSLSLCLSVYLSLSLTGFHYVALGDLARTCYVDHRHPPASASQVLKFNVYAITPGLQSRSFDFLKIISLFCVYGYVACIYLGTPCVCSVF